MDKYTGSAGDVDYGMGQVDEGLLCFLYRGV